MYTMSSGQLPRKWKFSDSSDKDPKINANLCTNFYLEIQKGAKNSSTHNLKVIFLHNNSKACPRAKKQTTQENDSKFAYRSIRSI